MLDRLNTSLLKATELLKHHALKITMAESCTGGGLCYWLTSVAGSSAWVERGFVTYSNQAKIDMLGVPAAIIEKEGAVSKATAIAMAAGALSHSTADLAISITGIAGPDGGSADKPVGTVWIGWAGRGIAPDAALYTFQGDRQTIRVETIICALDKINEIGLGMISEHL